MGVICESLDNASANTATRPIPKSADAQIRFLGKHENGSTRVVAQRLGISQRTVERYLTGQIKRPRPELAAKLAGEVARTGSRGCASGRSGRPRCRAWPPLSLSPTCASLAPSSRTPSS
ncbi:telomere-protecting terminal protein Tpg [Streptomyces sp. NPDC002917]|uniref:telomere-protecting terminal protein Tpg n=1 Tax=Streptomyces sp. NPDC002917 TaxID=3364671 RepID=UPI0036A6526C